MKFQKNIKVQYNIFGCSACGATGEVAWNGKKRTCPICKGTKEDCLKGKRWIEEEKKKNNSPETQNNTP